MPCAVTAFSVKIAAPSEAAIESIIAREVICDWNEQHALEQKRILLPLHGDHASGTTPSDLLMAFYCDAPGNPSDRGSAEGEKEIEAQLASGRPVLVYFSEARVDLHETQALEGRAMADFNRRFAAAMVECYGNEKEFRARFARQLEETMASHAHFKCEAPAAKSPETLPVVPEAPAPEELSSYAQIILSEACDDYEAYIGRMKVGTMLKIQANGKQLVEQGDPETMAKWDDAFHELLRGEYIRDAGCNGQLFQISTKGFAFLKTIGKTPVGYIAELGGM